MPPNAFDFTAQAVLIQVPECSGRTVVGSWKGGLTLTQSVLRERTGELELAESCFPYGTAVHARKFILKNHFYGKVH